MSDILTSIRNAIGSAFSTVFDTATLYRIASRTSDGRGGYRVTREDYSAKALVDDYSAFLRGTLGIPTAERKLIILGTSCSVTPQPGDIVTVQGGSWEVIEVRRDPAAATYECRAKPAPAPVASGFYVSLDFREARNSQYIGQVV